MVDVKSAMTRALLASLLLCGYAIAREAEDAALNEAQAAYHTAIGDMQVLRYAGPELKSARLTLEKAETLLKNGADKSQVEDYAYLATQQITVARQMAALKSAEDALKTASAEQTSIKTAEEVPQANGSTQQSAWEAEFASFGAQIPSAPVDEATALAQDPTRALKLDGAEPIPPTGKRELVITVNDGSFDAKSGRLGPGGTHIVDDVAAFLRAHPERTVYAEGFTDNTDTWHSNKVRSEQRANTVARALIGAGIAESRVHFRGYGKEFPVASNDTPSGRELNRRVEIAISNGSERLGKRIGEEWIKETVIRERNPLRSHTLSSQ